MNIKKESKDLLTKIVKKISTNAVDTRFIVGNQAITKLIREIALWNDDFKKGKNSFPISVSPILVSKIIHGKEFSGLECTFFIFK